MFELYRPEAVEYARVVRLGGASSAVPLGGWRIWGMVVAAFLGLLVLISFVQIPRHEIVPGWVKAAGATVRIESQGNWLVHEVFVHNGEHVQKSQPLFTASEVVGSIADSNVHAQMLNAAAQQVAALRQQSAVVELSRRTQGVALAERISAETEARKRIGAQIALQQRRSEIAREALNDVEQLVKKGFVTRLEYERRRDNALAVQQAGVDLERQDELLRADIANDQGSLARLSADTAAAAARLHGQIADAEANYVRVAGAANFVVRAPADGVLADWSLTPSTTMPPSALAGVLQTEPDHLIGEVFVPTSASGFLRQGQPVLLDYDAFPAAQFGFGRGTIISISSVPVAGQGTIFAGTATDRGYRAILRLEKFAPRTGERDWAFRSGLKFQAHFVIKRVPLWRALLAPLLGAEA